MDCGCEISHSEGFSHLQINRRHGKFLVAVCVIDLIDTMVFPRDGGFMVGG
jgi:hypothetical protein